MNRRSFLGSVFGLVVSSPFLFKSINDEVQRVKLPYRAFIRESSGIWIQAPAVQTIEKINDGYRLVVEPLNIKHTVAYDAMMLQTESGAVVLDNRFEQGAVCACNGDTLNPYFILTGEKNASLEELIQLKLRSYSGI